MKKSTTKAQDAAFILARMKELHRPRAVGDAVHVARGPDCTTIAKIDGPIITLANGDVLHFSNVRSVQS